jgi:hypothetical protein
MFANSAGESGTFGLHFGLAAMVGIAAAISSMEKIPAIFTSMIRFFFQCGCVGILLSHPPLLEERSIRLLM